MRRKRGFIFLGRCYLDSLVFCRGTGSEDAVKIWLLHLASYWLHIQAIIENTLIIYLFKRITFFVFRAGQLRLNGMFQVLSGSILQLLDLRARGVSWWKTKSLGYADLQDVLFAPFPGKRIYTKSNKSQTSSWGWQNGNAGFQRGQGASHLPWLLLTSDHSNILLIWDLETSVKFLNEKRNTNTQHFQLF